MGKVRPGHCACIGQPEHLVLCKFLSLSRIAIHPTIERLEPVPVRLLVEVRLLQLALHAIEQCGWFESCKDCSAVVGSLAANDAFAP